MSYYHKQLTTPLGPMDLVINDDGAVAVFSFAAADGLSRCVQKVQAAGECHLNANLPAFTGVEAQIQAYFDGKQQDFELNYEPLGTDFQRQVWDQLLKIPFGETRTYGDLAEALGRPSASRAVGAANGQNPVAVLIPCHRVIGSNGKLTGYAGGIHNKRWLLKHEGALLL